VAKASGASQFTDWGRKLVSPVCFSTDNFKFNSVLMMPAAKIIVREAITEKAITLVFMAG